MTIRELLVAGTDELSRAGVPSPRVDAEWLLAHALGIARSQLHVDGEMAADGRERVFRELVARRAKREPLAYVLGEWGFRRLTLRVAMRALFGLAVCNEAGHADRELGEVRLADRGAALLSVDDPSRLVDVIERFVDLHDERSRSRVVSG